MRTFLSFAFGILIFSEFFAQNTIQSVNPFIGTSNYGTTNPGALLPNGLMSVSPFNVSGSKENKFDKDKQWWSTPYTSDNNYFTGFSHVNLSGVGCPDLGSLLLMPTTGSLELDHKKYGSTYTNEFASPGYYTNTLTQYGIKTEVTATERSSIERYTFPKGQANILLNLELGLTNESGAWLKKKSETELEGMKLMGRFCYQSNVTYPIYFAVRVNKKPNETGYWKKQPKLGVEAQWSSFSDKNKIYNHYGRTIAADSIGAYFSYQLKERETIEVQMAVSTVSTENAWKNLEAEQKGFDFDGVRKNAEATWQKALSSIQIEGGTKDEQTVFYTALYHALIHPNIINDVNGNYIEMGGNQILSSPNKRYTVFSLWDTYRNLHQLLTLLYPEKQMDMVRTMVDMYKESGWLPKWELYNNETHTMEGDPAIPVIVDSWMKGLRDFDTNSAYEAMIKSATTEGKNNALRPDNDDYWKLGYVPLREQYDNSVSHALEYYVADNALSKFAKALGHTKDAKKFYDQSLNYKKYYSKEYSLLRPILPNGQFLNPFNPKQGENFEAVPGFHEGSAWNYSFMIPHDVPGMIQLYGGKKAFVNKLWEVFSENHYDPANEPDIAYPYLFSYVKGEEWRTQELTQNLLTKYFKNEPAGLPGNDDTGTMSTWAIFSMIGFYPDNPTEPAYTFTTPVFDKIKLQIPNLKGESHTLEIEVKGRTNDNKYIKNIAIDGKPYPSFRISHLDLIKARKIVFELHDKKG